MTDEETKQFLLVMRRYAISRRAPQDSIDEWPAWAWEMREIRKRKGTTKQLWQNFVRDRLGALGSHKQKVEKAIHFRQATTPSRDGSGKLDFLEHRVPAPEQGPLAQLQSLPKKDQMILFLVQAGFSLGEITSEFGRSNKGALAEKRARRMRWSRSEEVSEMLEKDLATLSPSADGAAIFSKALEQRRQLALLFDWGVDLDADLAS